MKKNNGLAPTSNLYKKSNLVSGFTLIELLTAIAIIGILSAIVMVSLTSARLKSKDKAVMTELSSIKVQAEIYHDLNAGNGYFGVCGAPKSSHGLGGSSSQEGLLKDVQKVTGIPSTIKVDNNMAGSYNIITCHDSTTYWAVEAPTSKSTEASPSMYCVDSKNQVTEKTTNLGVNDTQC